MPSVGEIGEIMNGLGMTIETGWFSYTVIGAFCSEGLLPADDYQTIINGPKATLPVLSGNVCYEATLRGAGESQSQHAPFCETDAIPTCIRKPERNLENICLRLRGMRVA